jgi:hypothetical protein
MLLRLRQHRVDSSLPATGCAVFDNTVFEGIWIGAGREADGANGAGGGGGGSGSGAEGDGFGGAMDGGGGGGGANDTLGPPPPLQEISTVTSTQAN